MMFIRQHDHTDIKSTLLILVYMGPDGRCTPIAKMAYQHDERDPNRTRFKHDTSLRALHYARENVLEDLEEGVPVEVAISRRVRMQRADAWVI